ncbi:MAG: polyprenyl synthetase family protein [Clostridia bacterium]|nr:polyprenyl synthetase family protein [Clostridia bacterium]
MVQRYEVFRRAVEDELQRLPLLGIKGEEAANAPSEPPGEGEVPEPLRSAMGYSLRLPGKRLRPVLLLASYAILQEDWRICLPFACAVEMIHAYSLVHDDLPALDDDEYRRGKPTNHKIFGENFAILAGDGLLSMAFETMLSAPLCGERPAKALAAMREIAFRAGVRGMVAGQTLDVALEGAQPRQDMVEYIHKHKTADLLTASVLAGLLLAGANLPQLTAGQAYGENLGLAFQMVDDLLDVEGNAAIMGKQTGMDAKRGKMTWPALFGEEQTRRDAGQAAARAMEALSAFGACAEVEFLRNLAQDTLVRVK